MCLHVSLCFDMQYDYFKNDLLIPLRGQMVCVRTENVLARCSMLHCLEFDMQHDYFQKINVLTF